MCCLLTAAQNGNGLAIESYARQVADLWRRYVSERQFYYNKESRWMNRVFWRRRAGVRLEILYNVAALHPHTAAADFFRLRVEILIAEVWAKNPCSGRQRNLHDRSSLRGQIHHDKLRGFEELIGVA